MMHLRKGAMNIDMADALLVRYELAVAGRRLPDLFIV
jgi:hypothetical protein